MPAATLLYNGHGWTGDKADPALAVPVPRLRSRLNRTFLASWDLVQPAPGVYDWTLLDAVVAANDAQGLRLVLCIANVPAWTAGRRDFSELWAAYLTRLTLRYPRAVIELGNEVDAPGWMAHQPQALGQLQRTGADAVAAAGTGALVIAGSVQGLTLRDGDGLHHLALMLDGYGQPPAAVSVHIYTETTPLADVGRVLDAVRGVLLSRYCRDTALWVTECGDARFSTWTEAQRATYLRAMFRAFRGAGVAESLFWAADDPTVYGTADRASLRRVWNAAVGSVFGPANAEAMG